MSITHCSIPLISERQLSEDMIIKKNTLRINMNLLWINPIEGGTDNDCLCFKKGCQSAIATEYFFIPLPVVPILSYFNIYVNQTKYFNKTKNLAELGGCSNTNGVLKVIPLYLNWI